MDSEGKIEHPYYPRDLNIPHYKPNVISITELLGLFFSCVFVTLIITWIFTTKRKFTIGYRLLLCWFTVCGFIHSVLEGYFAYYHDSLAGRSSYLAEMCAHSITGNPNCRWQSEQQICKQVGRTRLSDTFTVCMESITALIDGPLCFMTVAAYLTRSPYRFALQLVVSLCQLYGDSLYILTEIKDGFIHSEMYHPLHFWFYFWFLNSFWIIVPLIMICHAVKNIVKSQSFADSRNPGIKNEFMQDSHRVSHKKRR